MYEWPYVFSFYLSRFLRSLIDFDIAIDIIMMMENKYYTMKKTVKTSAICRALTNTNFNKLVDKKHPKPDLGSRGSALISWKSGYELELIDGKIPLNE